MNYIKGEVWPHGNRDFTPHPKLRRCACGRLYERYYACDQGACEKCTGKIENEFKDQQRRDAESPK